MIAKAPEKPVFTIAIDPAQEPIQLTVSKLENAPIGTAWTQTVPQPVEFSTGTVSQTLTRIDENQYVVSRSTLVNGHPRATSSTFILKEGVLLQPEAENRRNPSTTFPDANQLRTGAQTSALGKTTSVQIN